MTIRAAYNSECTLLRKLNRKKYRYREQLFLIEGARAIQQLLANGVIQVQTLFWDESAKLWEQPQWAAYNGPHEWATLEAEVFQEVSDTDHPQGVLALCTMPEEPALQQLAAQQGVIIALDGLQDPGNAGTIIRTAAWFGAAGLLAGTGTVDLYHPKVVRSTAGATGSVPFINGELEALLPELEAAGWQTLLLDASAEATPLPEVTRNKQTILVIGNEAHGIRPSLAAAGRTRAKIISPHARTPVESLNAGVATSIALYALGG